MKVDNKASTHSDWMVSYEKQKSTFCLQCRNDRCSICHIDLADFTNRIVERGNSISLVRDPYDPSVASCDRYAFGDRTDDRMCTCQSTYRLYHMGCIIWFTGDLARDTGNTSSSKNSPHTCSFIATCYLQCNHCPLLCLNMLIILRAPFRFSSLP